MTAAPPLVAFDFDGTLTRSDSFLTFLAHKYSKWERYARYARLTGALAKYAVDQDRTALKTSLLRAFLRGRALAELTASAEAFAEAPGDHFYRPEALDAWNRWRDAGARLVIVSASPEFLVKPFAAKLGAEACLATVLEIDADGALTGQLAGPNCRGPEKVRRLKQAFGEPLSLAAAYGDSRGDREMLALAEISAFRRFDVGPDSARSGTRT